MAPCAPVHATCPPEQLRPRHGGRTKPISLDDVTIDRDPATDAKGNVIAYTMPLLVLVDDMSAPGGDAFAPTIQDNARGPLLG